MCGATVPALWGSVRAMAEVLYAKESPLARNALQCALAPIIELDANAHHMGTHCLTDQHFARSG